jgi:hypothetical protein
MTKYDQIKELDKLESTHLSFSQLQNTMSQLGATADEIVLYFKSRNLKLVVIPEELTTLVKPE